MMKKQLKSEDGFSLVEVLLTISLIGILSVSIVSLFSENVKKQRRMKDQLTAALFAQQGLDKIFADKTENGYDYIDAQNYSTETFKNVERNFSINTITASLKEVKVFVTCGNYSDSLITYVGKYN